MTWTGLKNVAVEARPLARLAAPVSIGMASDLVMGFIDNILVGRLGAAPLAAAAFANTLLMFFVMVGGAFSLCLAPFVAQSLGRGDRAGAHRLIASGMVLNALVTVVCMAGLGLCWLWFDRFGQPAEVVLLGRPYFAVLAATFVFVLPFQAAKGGLEGFGFTGVPMVAAVAGVAVNAVVAYGLVYGKWGWPELGLNGAAVATGVGRVVRLALVLVLPLCMVRVRKALFSAELFSWSPADIRLLARLGLPASGSVFFEVVAFSGASIMMGWVGTVALAAHQVVLSLASFTFLLAMGVGTAGGIRVGHWLGFGDMRMARTAGVAAIGVAVGLMATTGLVFVAFRNLLPALFVKESEVIVIAAGMLLVAALFQVFDGVQVVGSNLLRALGDVRVPMALTLAAYWGIALPTGYLCGFVFGMGGVGIWVGLFVGLFTAAILLSARFARLTTPQS